MKIQEMIDFLTENFDERQRKNMSVSLVRDYNYDPGFPEPIDAFCVKCGVNGVEIHISAY